MKLERNNNQADEATYVAGLQAIAQKRGVSIDEAAQIARQDILEGGGVEHLEPLAEALRYLKANQHSSREQTS